jgi:hypothetical protein
MKIVAHIAARSRVAPDTAMDSPLGESSSNTAKLSITPQSAHLTTVTFDHFWEKLWSSTLGEITVVRGSAIFLDVKDQGLHLISTYSGPIFSTTMTLQRKIANMHPYELQE